MTMAKKNLLLALVWLSSEREREDLLVLFIDGIGATSAVNKFRMGLQFHGITSYSLYFALPNSNRETA
jgi:hypothetical protein